MRGKLTVGTAEGHGEDGDRRRCNLVYTLHGQTPRGSRIDVACRSRGRRGVVSDADRVNSGFPYAWRCVDAREHSKPSMAEDRTNSEALAVRHRAARVRCAALA